MSDTNQDRKKRRYSEACKYRESRDRIEVHVTKGLKPAYQAAIAPKTLKGSIEEHMEQVVKDHIEKNQ